MVETIQIERRAGNIYEARINGRYLGEFVGLANAVAAVWNDDEVTPPFRPYLCDECGRLVSAGNHQGPKCLRCMMRIHGSVRAVQAAIQDAEATELS